MVICSIFSLNILMELLAHKFSHQAKRFYDQKGETYDSILISINMFTKIVYYKPVQIILDITDLDNIMIKVVLQQVSF